MKRNLTLIFACFLFLAVASAQRTRQTDSLALVALYNATGGPAWTHRENWLTGNINSWYGVSTQASSGRIDSLRLCANNLQGELPDALVGLDSLQFLLMQDNYLYGHIPELGKIPYYDSLSKFVIEFDKRPCYQCQPLRGNLYSFTDIAENPEVEKATYDNQGGVSTVYEQIHKSQSFSRDTLMVVKDGAAVELKFNYKSDPRFPFVWTNGKVSLTTADPVLRIPNFTAATHAGRWSCTMVRISPPELSLSDCWQSSGVFLLITEGTQEQLLVTHRKHSSLDWKDETLPNEYIRTAKEQFPALNFVAESTSSFPTQLKLKIVKLPEHFQLSVSGEINASVASMSDGMPDLYNDALTYDSESSFVAGSIMTGYGSYTVHIRPKGVRVPCIDTIIVHAMGLNGASNQDTFLLRSIADDLLLKKPEISQNQVSLREESTGLWIRWDGLNAGVERLQMVTRIAPVSGGCGADMANARLIKDTTLSSLRGHDSIYIAWPSALSATDSYVQVALTPFNPTGRGLKVSLKHKFARPPQRYPDGYLDTTYSALNNILLIDNNIITTCGSNFIHCSIDGTLVSRQEIWSGNSAAFTPEEGKVCRYWLADNDGNFSSDTILLQLKPSVRRPVFTSALAWTLGCRKTVLYESIINTDQPFTVTSRGSKHCSARTDDTAIQITVNSPWIGTDTLDLRFTAPNGTVTDTVALLCYKPELATVLFPADTVRLALDNKWVKFNIGNYLASGINPADLELSPIRCDSILFRMGYTEIRPAINYKIDYYPTKYTLLNFKGKDTVVLEANYSDCSRDTLVIIATCTATIAEKTALPLIDHQKFNTFDAAHLQRDPSLPYEGAAFYAGEPESFPTRIDLREILMDGIDTAGFTYIFAPEGIAKDKIEFVFDGPYITIRPKNGLFYGYQKKNEFGSWSAPLFKCLFTIKNRAGEWEEFWFYVSVTERPIAAGGDTLQICGQDTLRIDVLGDMRQKLGTITEITDWSDKSTGFLTSGLCDAKGYAKVWIRNGAVQPIEDQIRFSLLYTTPFGRNESYIKDYIVKVLPTCDDAPVLAGIPVQYIGTVAPQLDLWVHVQDNWPASGLFWDLTGGSKLNWQYDYATGILTAQPKTAGWKGTDTITVTVTDPNGLKSSTSAIYTTGLVEIKLSSCASYTFGNRILDKSGTYTEKFKAVSGADSTVILHLTVNPVYSVTTTKSVAYGEAYQFGTQRLTKNGSYTEVFKSVNGCDSTVTLAFTVLPEGTKVANIAMTACGEYTFAGKKLISSGVYKDTLIAISGADSVVILTLTINPVYTVKDTVKLALGTTYSFGTQNITSEGSYTETFKSVNGCDSTVMLELQIIPPTVSVSNYTATACEGSVYRFGDRDLTQAGDYSDTVTYNGYILFISNVHLVFKHVPVTKLDKTVPYGKVYVLGSKTHSATGDYSETFLTAEGCDSVVNLHLTVLPEGTKLKDISKTACGEYTFAGKTLTASGIYKDTLKAVSGADSIVALTLTINPVYNLQATKSVTFGQTYQFGTQKLDKSGSFTEKFQSVNGCDSTVTLAFMVLPEDTKLTEIEETACGEYTFAGKTLTTSGIYKDTLKAVSGADSIVVLTLTINPVYNLQATKSVLYGQTYQFGTQKLDKSGSFTEKFQSVNGCDSTVTLAFTVLPNSAPHITLAVREFSLAENSANGTTVATITATGSEGAALVYSISGSTAFAIDPATGTVMVKDSSLLDFETNKTVTFTVRVSDGTSYDEAEITVTLTDVVETGLPMNTETIIIFPNTFSDRLSILGTAFHGTVLITAQNGAEVYSAEFGGYTDISTRNWPAGKYTVSIVSGTQVYSETLIKE